MRISRGAQAACTFVLLLSRAIGAAGFEQPEQDAAAAGRGGTALARAGFPSALHYNPAGLGALVGPAATVGGSVAQHAAQFDLASGGGTERGLSAVRGAPHAYAAFGTGKLGGGVGFEVPFSGGVRWQEDWSGRAERVELALEVLAGSCGAAYQATSWLSVGATASVEVARIEQRRKDSSGPQNISEGALGIGVQVGALVQISERARLGAVARAPTRLARDLELPGQLSLGAESQAGRFRLFGEAALTFWGPSPPLGGTSLLGSPSGAVRAGLEHDLGSITFRAGLAVESPAWPAGTFAGSIPDGPSGAATLGLGKDFGFLRVDLAYHRSFLPAHGRAGEVEGRFRADSNRVTASLGLKTAP